MFHKKGVLRKIHRETVAQKPVPQCLLIKLKKRDCGTNTSGDSWNAGTPLQLYILLLSFSLWEYFQIKIQETKNYFNIFLWSWSKMRWLFRLWYSNFSIISRMMWSIKLIFCMKVKSYFSYFSSYWMGKVKFMRGFWGHGTLKSAVSQEWMDELSCDFFACW